MLRLVILYIGSRLYSMLLRFVINQYSHQEPKKRTTSTTLDSLPRAHASVDFAMQFPSLCVQITPSLIFFSDGPLVFLCGPLWRSTSSWHCHAFGSGNPLSGFVFGSEHSLPPIRIFCLAKIVTELTYAYDELGILGGGITSEFGVCCRFSARLSSMVSRF